MLINISLSSIRSSKNSLNRPIHNTSEGIINFWKWFDKSKLVDSNGHPIVMFHGTALDGYIESTDIHAFDKSKIGDRFRYDRKGFFFVNTSKLADFYTNSDRDYYEKGSGSGVMYPVYLKCLNPLIIDDKFLRNKNMTTLGINDDVISFWDNYQLLILKWARTKDSVILIDTSNGKHHIMAVVFEPNQIKSALGNTGSFRENDHRLVAGASKEETDEFYNLNRQYYEKRDAVRDGQLSHESWKSYIERLEELREIVFPTQNPDPLKVDDTYKGSHEAPDNESGEPIWKLTEDYFYAHDDIERRGANILRSIQNRPNIPILVYRAIPKDIKSKINVGDWVTTVKAYAKEHGQAHLRNNYRIIQKTVMVRDLFTDGNSTCEFGYDPQPRVRK